MDDLKSLKKKLIDLQKAGPSFKLSERTVVDIIQKLADRKKINLIHTISGTEYLTIEKLSKEIQDLIKKHKGRISKQELQKIADVQNSILEERLSLLLKKDQSLSIIEGNIIANYYLETISTEIDTLVASHGNLNISEISSKYDLSIDFFKGFLKSKIDSGAIKGRLFPTRLITDLYIDSQTQRLRPLLIASICPVNIQTLIETYKLDELLINELIDQLISSKVVRGKVVSGIFYPAIFEKCQDSYILGALSQNNYIEYSKLSIIGIKNAKNYLKSKNLKGLFLTDCFINENTRVNFESTVYDNLQKDVITNLNSFNFDLNEDDLNTLLLACNIKPQNIIFLNNNLISKGLIDKAYEEIKSLMKVEALNQYNKWVEKKKELEEKKKQEELEREKEKEAEKNEGKDEKGGKGKKKQEKAPAKGKKEGKKGKDAKEDELDESTFLIINNDIREKIFKTFKNFLKSSDDINSQDETIKSLFEEQLISKCQDQYTFLVKDYLKSHSSSVSSAKDKKVSGTTSEKDSKNTLQNIENSFQELKLIFKTIDNLTLLSKEPSFVKNINIITSNAVRCELTSFFRDILTFQLVHMKQSIDTSKDLLKHNDRTEVISKIADTELNQIFSSMNKAIQEKNYQSFMEVLTKNCFNLAISITPNDKKKEKAILNTYRSNLQELIDEKFSMVGKVRKKEYLGFLIDMCQMVINKLDNFIIKLPYESWAVTVYLTLFGEKEINIAEGKRLGDSINEILNLPDEEYDSKQDEISELFKKFLNII